MTRVQRYPGDWLTDVLHEDRGAMCVQRRERRAPRGARECWNPHVMYYLYLLIHPWIHPNPTAIATHTPPLAHTSFPGPF